jgi:D-glycero-beta-D-manno-heptose 1-phosphate adenylyltransferase
MKEGSDRSRGARFLSRAELVALLDQRRREGRLGRVVLTNGCFDVLHVGHLRYLEDARSRGDHLIVAVNSDASVRGLKGAPRPIQPLAERAELLLGLRAVDWVVPFEEPTLEETLRALRPEVHAKGTDYTVDSVPEREVDRELGVEIAICGDRKTHSSSELIERIGDDS